MSLKKPSELFNQKPKNKIELSSYDSNSLPENFDVYKSNIKNIEILNDFTDSFGTFKDNIQKVDNLEKVIHSPLDGKLILETNDSITISGSEDNKLKMIISLLETANA